MSEYRSEMLRKRLFPFNIQNIQKWHEYPESPPRTSPEESSVELKDAETVQQKTHPHVPTEEPALPLLFCRYTQTDDCTTSSKKEARVRRKSSFSSKTIVTNNETKLYKLRRRKSKRLYQMNREESLPSASLQSRIDVGVSPMEPIGIEDEEETVIVSGSSSASSLVLPSQPVSRPRRFKLKASTVPIRYSATTLRRSAVKKVNNTNKTEVKLDSMLTMIDGLLAASRNEPAMSKITGYFQTLKKEINFCLKNKISPKLSNTQDTPGDILSNNTQEIGNIPGNKQMTKVIDPMTDIIETKILKKKVRGTSKRSNDNLYSLKRIKARMAEENRRNRKSHYVGISAMQHYLPDSLNCEIGDEQDWNRRDRDERAADRKFSSLLQEMFEIDPATAEALDGNGLQVEKQENQLDVREFLYRLQKELKAEQTRKPSFSSFDAKDREYYRMKALKCGRKKLFPGKTPLISSVKLSEVLYDKPNSTEPPVPNQLTVKKSLKDTCSHEDLQNADVELTPPAVTTYGITDIATGRKVRVSSTDIDQTVQLKILAKLYNDNLVKNAIGSAISEIPAKRKYRSLKVGLMRLDAILKDIAREDYLNELELAIQRNNKKEPLDSANTTNDNGLGLVAYKLISRLKSNGSDKIGDLMSTIGSITQLSKKFTFKVKPAKTSVNSIKKKRLSGGFFVERKKGKSLSIKTHNIKNRTKPSEQKKTITKNRSSKDKVAGGYKRGSIQSNYSRKYFNKHSRRSPRIFKSKEATSIRQKVSGSGKTQDFGFGPKGTAFKKTKSFHVLKFVESPIVKILHGKRKNSTSLKRKELPASVAKETVFMKRKGSPVGRRRESPATKRKLSPWVRRKDSPTVRRKQSPVFKRKNSPFFKKRRESPNVVKRKESPVVAKRKESPLFKPKETMAIVNESITTNPREWTVLKNRVDVWKSSTFRDLRKQLGLNKNNSQLEFYRASLHEGRKWDPAHDLPLITSSYQVRQLSTPHEVHQATPSPSEIRKSTLVKHMTKSAVSHHSQKYGLTYIRKTSAGHETGKSSNFPDPPRFGYRPRMPTYWRRNGSISDGPKSCVSHEVNLSSHFRDNRKSSPSGDISDSVKHRQRTLTSLFARRTKPNLKIEAGPSRRSFLRKDHFHVKKELERNENLENGVITLAKMNPGALEIQVKDSSSSTESLINIIYKLTNSDLDNDYAVHDPADPWDIYKSDDDKSDRAKTGNEKLHSEKFDNLTTVDETSEYIDQGDETTDAEMKEYDTTDIENDSENEEIVRKDFQRVQPWDDKVDEKQGEMNIEGGTKGFDNKDVRVKKVAFTETEKRIQWKPSHRPFKKGGIIEKRNAKLRADRRAKEREKRLALLSSIKPDPFVLDMTVARITKSSDDSAQKGPAANKAKTDFEPVHGQGEPSGEKLKANAVLTSTRLTSLSEKTSQPPTAQKQSASQCKSVTSKESQLELDQSAQRKVNVDMYTT